MSAMSLAPRAAWRMLLALCCGFALSQAFRTVAALMAKPLEQQFGLSPAELGAFAALFHFTFGAMQLLMGVGIDLWGVRRTILSAFPLAAAGALLTAAAPSFPLVLLGQGLIGVGCAPAFLVCTVFIARHFAVERFAAISGICMSVGGIGMLATGTPLAWVIDAFSWRAGFLMLGLAALAAWGVMFAVVKEPAGAARGPTETFGQALARIGALFALPHTLGILLLAAVTYASFITLRGLWLGPLLIERHGFSLVQTGNVALAVSLFSLVGAPVFGRLAVRGMGRRRVILGYTLLMALLFAVIGVVRLAWLDVVAALAIAFVSGYIVLQYADVRASYPEAMTGRALAVFTMAMFLGVAAMQWLTGGVASLARAHGVDTFLAVNASIALLLVVGAIGFKALPARVDER